jgi:4-hydroxybenzoate polyprenyltransferase|tara:strand:- start:4223 stop:5104 length:882 start_codon:yes stop_codon:yes gene_type:complete
MKNYNLTIFDFLRLIRFKNQIKNLIVFLPVFFAGEVSMVSQNFYLSIQVFVLFFFSTSISYLINDFFDFDQDKVHPEKSNKIIFKKNLSKYFLLKLILIFSVFYSLSLVILEINFVSKLLTLFYLLLVSLYSVVLKKIIYIEIIAVSIGYVVRLLSAEFTTNLYSDFLIFVIMFSSVFFVILLKRYSELKKYVQFRKVLKSYNPKTLLYLIFANYSFVIITHFYFTLQDEIYGSYGLGGVLSNVFVIMVLTKFLIAGLKQHAFEDPTNYLFRDVVSIASILLYVGIFSLIMYF